MKLPFRILHLEDSPHDCELVRQLLINDGIDCKTTRCENREQFIRNLEKKDFDLIFADCTLPSFSGLHALELARRQAPEIPFIFVSGTIEEDSAIESLRNGATDYVLKHRLSRLVPAVRRAIAETEERTKSHEMEERLRHALRLEAVGTLAGGIAHDFNNILTIIKGYTALLPMQCGQPDRVREIVGTIDRASQRGSELVNQMLTFARESEGSFASTEINQRAREIASMLTPSMSPNVAFELQLEEGLPEIHADPGQVERALINLATNARDAMPDGGTITLSTSRVQGNETPLRAGHETEQYLRLRVTDTGCGMDEATRRRIFEPFFTTKPRGKGTGLGMAVVYGLMQSHDGFVDVVSEPGKGTSISLFFPIPATPSAHPVERRPDAPKSLKGTETMLIVDDESDVLYCLGIILQAHGYHILPARDAETALETLRLHPGKVHLLFSDVRLPTMDGFELNRRVRLIEPGLKTILCSGYTDAALKTKMAEHAIDGFIPKPYNGNDLLEAIRAVLDKEEQTQGAP